jgi:predicted RNA-binding protein (virulence factor B family)
MSLLGKYATLNVIKLVEFGAYLKAGEDEILLPKRYVPENCKPGDDVDVFIYKDSDDRIIATTLKPLAIPGEAAYLTVKQTTGVGTFLEWGIAKDLLVPFSEQKNEMRDDRQYLVYVFVDDETDRIAATTKVGRFIKNDVLDVNEGDEVELLICDTTDLGYRTIINNRYWGLLYKNEVFGKISEGEKRKGFIKKIREENKIDVSLQKQSYDEVTDASSKILSQLNQQPDFFLPLHDKTEPDVIYKHLGMSKKVFKKSIGLLFKERKIEILENGIRLVEEGE